jgi:hypothetical protein
VPWPLEDAAASRADGGVSQSSRDVEEYFPGLLPDGHLALHVVPDFALAQRYATACAQLDIPTRTLVCETELSYPILSDAQAYVKQGVFLGYDYASHACDFSLLVDDLFGQEVKELREFRGQLNNCGLFAAFDLICRYLAIRRVIASREGLESDENCTIFGVHELTQNDMTTR